MGASEFKWDDNALIPDSVEVTFQSKDDDKFKKEKVTFYEFPRLTLVEFVTESMDKKFIEIDAETGQPKRDENDIIIRRPFGDVADEQAELLFKYLAKASRDVKDIGFFRDLDLTSKGMYALVDMLLSINHLNEILATGGNWLMLPTVREMLSGAEKVVSESQKPTLQA
jgi:hypothetical protein